DVGFYDPSANVEEDRALATAIKDAGNVLLAMQGAGDGVLGDHTTHYVNILLPIPLLREAAAGVGAVNVNPDPDGRVRDTPLLINGPDGTTYYSLPLVAAAKKLRADLGAAKRAGDLLIMPAPLGDRVMPIDRRGGMSVYYAAPPAPATYDNPATYPCKDARYLCVVSMKDVINGAISRDYIVGRAILIGAHSLSAVPDAYPV